MSLTDELRHTPLYCTLKRRGDEAVEAVHTRLVVISEKKPYDEDVDHWIVALGAPDDIASEAEQRFLDWGLEAYDRLKVKLKSGTLAKSKQVGTSRLLASITNLLRHLVAFLNALDAPASNVAADELFQQARSRKLTQMLLKIKDRP